MKVTVQLALVDGKRTLISSEGKIWTSLSGWVEPRTEVLRVPGPCYQKWSDVPAGWLGSGVPYFR